jgi:hypothetical protein
MTTNSYDEMELVGFLSAFDDDDLPDGAWWAVLESGAEAFIHEYGVKGKDENDLVHEYLQALQKGDWSELAGSGK